MSGELVPVLFANLCGGIFVLVLLVLGIYLVISIVISCSNKCRYICLLHRW